MGSVSMYLAEEAGRRNARRAFGVVGRGKPQAEHMSSAQSININKTSNIRMFERPVRVLDHKLRLQVMITLRALPLFRTLIHQQTFQCLVVFLLSVAHACMPRFDNRAAASRYGMNCM